MSPVPQPEGERDRPNNPNSDLDNLEYDDVVINADSSDDDDAAADDDDGYMGYQALPLNNGNESSEDEGIGYEGLNQDVDEQSDGQTVNVTEGTAYPVSLHQLADGSGVPSYMQVPEIPRPHKEDLLWNQPGSSDISMETGQEEKIRSVMAGIKLPSCNIPDWAKTLSDDQWESQIVSKLKGTSQAPVDKGQSESTKSESESTKSENTTNDCDKSGAPHNDNTRLSSTSKLDSPD